MENKSYLIFGTLLAVSYLLGRSHAPTKTIEVEKEKIVYKTVEVETWKQNSETTLTTVKKPNGTILTKLKTKTLKTSENTTKTQATVEHQKEKITETKKHTYLGLLSNGKIHALQAHRQFIGPIQLGASINSDKQLLLSVGFAF